MRKKISILEDSTKKLIYYSILFFVAVLLIGFAITRYSYYEQIQKLEKNYEKYKDLSTNEEFLTEIENIRKYLNDEQDYVKINTREMIDSAYEIIKSSQNTNEIANTYPIKVDLLKGVDFKYPHYAKYLELEDGKFLKISIDDKKYDFFKRHIAEHDVKNIHNNSYINFETIGLSSDFSFIGDDNWYCENTGKSYICYDKNWKLKLIFTPNMDYIKEEIIKAKDEIYKNFLLNIFFLICTVVIGFLLIYTYVIGRKREFKKQIELITKYFNGIISDSNNIFNKRSKINYEFEYKEFRTLCSVLLGFLRKIKSKDADLKKQVYKDSVTGLMNAMSIHKALKNYEKKTGKVLLFCFFNIENFRIYNSMYGRDFGDEVLRVVGFRIYATLKGLKIGDNDYLNAREYKNNEKYHLLQNENNFECLARVSADEFLLVVEVNEDEDFAKIAKKYRTELISKYVIIDSNDDLIRYEPFKINIRIGYSIYPKDSEKILECIGNADMAIENEKANIQGGVFGYTAAIGAENDEYLQLQKDIRHGILNKEFILYYQPKVDCKTGRIIGAESLVRWQKGDRLIMPDSFIEICERSSLIIALGNEIIKMACDAQRRWIKLGFNIKLSINLSTKQLLSDNIVQVIEKNIEGIDPKLLEFEITESFSIESETSKEIVDRIKKLGVGLSMDDFGKGYSSLSYLNDKDLDFDVIKIDKSFIQNIDTNVTNRKLVEFIVNLIKTLNKRSVAEGVENIEILNFLQELGCDEYQGYYFSKPIPENELIKKVKKYGSN